MLVPAGSPILFLRELRFAVRCCVITLRQLLWTLCTLLFMLNVCLLHIFLYIFFINIECATLYDYLNVEFQTQLYRPVYIQLETRDPKSEKLIAIPIDYLLKKLNLHDCI